MLVIISDGGNTVKGTTYDMALEQALRGEVMVYPIIDVPISASAGRDLAGEHALITLAQETGGSTTMRTPLRWTGPSLSCRKTCGPNTCLATIHPIDWAAAFAASLSSCAARLAQVMSSAIGPAIILRHYRDRSLSKLKNSRVRNIC